MQLDFWFVILGHITLMTIGYLTMQDYPSYTRLNSNGLKTLPSYEPTVAVRQWPAQQPVAGLVESALRTSGTDNTMSDSVMDCLVTLGLIMFLLLSSSVVLGFTADRLTQGIIMLVEHQATDTDAVVQ